MINNKKGNKKKNNNSSKDNHIYLDREIEQTFRNTAKKHVGQKLLIGRGWYKIALQEAMSDWVKKVEREGAVL